MKKWQVYAILWLACSLVSYPMNRSFDLETTGKWTRDKRAAAVVIAAMGPVALALDLLYLVAAYKDGKASW